MIRIFEHETRPAFVLDTQRTTYAFRVLPTGQLEHLYYGARIGVGRMEDLAALEEKHAFAPSCSIVYDNEHPELSLEDACLEYSSPGKGDLREPMLELVHADGGRTSDFVYESAETAEVKAESPGLPGSYSEDGRAEQLRVTLRDEQYNLRLELRFTVWADCDCICRDARLVNDSADPVEIERLLSMQLDLPEHGWTVSTFHGAHCREMERYPIPLPAGKLVNQARGGCSSNHSNPFFMVHRPDTAEEQGDCYAFNLVYSGNHYAAAEVSAFGKTRVAAGLSPEGFRWHLGAREAFVTPEAVMSFSPEGFSGISANMHRFVREHIVRGVWKRKARPVLLNSWEACYFDISETSLVSLARAGKDLGIELFVMDDGWFGARDDDHRALGDWEPNRRKLPGGLKSLAKKITALGMRFGIWVEPEMVNVDSRLFEAHPDWSCAIPGATHSEGRYQRLLDLANPEVQDFVIEKMTEVFSSADISYVKWDFNRFFSDVYSPALPPERQGEVGHRNVLGLYRVMQTLTERFPDILFEGCASGGNRFDLGILSYFPQIWASDNTDALARASIQEGYSYGYPLSVIGAHVSACPNHQTLRETPLETRFNVAAFGLLGYELDLRALDAEDRREIRAQIALYKRWRETLQFGQFYRGRITGGTHEWTAVSPDGSRAVGMLLQEQVVANLHFERFLPRGLNPASRYHFYSVARRINLKHFGSLVNTVAPFHVKQDSLVHNVIAKTVHMSAEREDATGFGDALMRSGVKLSPSFAGTGYTEGVRVFRDYSSRMYFMEETE
ncbi:MAG: alpha-galactosidase [Oscillospiraceae bacterium]|nr:alpha-galactosidase [Oscillospiraceae bacterium]